MPSATSASTSKAINRLTPLEVKNAKPDEGKTEKNLNDGGRLYLVATATRKRWQFQYGLNGKMHKQWLGDYPKVSLAQARKLRDEAAKAVDDGKDPRIERQAAKVAAKYAAANTFEMVAREWHSKELAGKGWSDDHAARILQRITADLFPVLGSRPIESLKTRDLLHPLQLVAKRDALDLAKRLRQYLTAIMRYAVQTGRIETNPAHDLQGAIASRKATHHAALPLSCRSAEYLASAQGFESACVVVPLISDRYRCISFAKRVCNHIRMHD